MCVLKVCPHSALSCVWVRRVCRVCGIIIYWCTFRVGVAHEHLGG